MLNRIRVLGRRMRGLVSRRRLDEEFQQELDAHLEMLTEENLRRGMSPEEARRTARVQLGGITQLRETNREMWSIPWLDTVLQDLRYGLRQLRRNPGFTAVAVLTLALGIGGTTAIFNLLYSALWHRLPYKDPGRLVAVVIHDPNRPSSDTWAQVSSAEFLDFKEQNRVFDQVMGYAEATLLMTGPNIAPDLFWVERVTPNTFRVLGVRPILGRTFTPEDAKPGAPPVVVLSYEEWQSKFGGSPGIVGQTIFLNHQPTVVIGVMTPRFRGYFGGRPGPKGWVPAIFSKAVTKGPGQLTWVIGHLKPGATVAQASSDVEFLAKRFAATYPRQHPKGTTCSVESFNGDGGWQTGRTLNILMGGIGLLLLIACVNIANLLLARASTREREIAIRAAVGASRGRLLRQFMVESLLVAAGGAFFGSMIAWTVSSGVGSILPVYYIYSEDQVRANAVSGWVLMFTVGIALTSTLLFGLAPAILAVRRDLQAPLKGGGRGTGETQGHHRLRNLLVVCEVALSLVLLIGGGLLFRSFWALRHLDLGYNVSNTLEAWAGLPQERYRTVEQRSQFNQEVLRRVRSLPGVVSVGLGSGNMDWAVAASVEIAGQSGSEGQNVCLRMAGDGFFKTLEIPLLSGRTISEEDTAHARRVAVVSQAFARKYFPGKSPLGRQIKVTPQRWSSLPKGAAFEIVGVVGGTKHTSPYSQEPSVQPLIFLPITVEGSSSPHFFVRTAGSPALMVNAVQEQFAALDKDLFSVARPVRDDFRMWYVEPRFIMSMLVSFALLGMALVCIGVYGVLSYAVSQRTQEFGIRMALGAQASEVHRMVLAWGLRWLAIGIGIGIPASIVLEKILQNRMWGIKSADPLTMVAVSLALMLVGLLACYIPARRAAKVDPMVALRYE
jgi:putative ABC transport system permease protein